MVVRTQRSRNAHGSSGRTLASALPALQRGGYQLRDRRLDHLTKSATKPFLRLDETILKPSDFYKEA